jgi:hypothetical protein
VDKIQYYGLIYSKVTLGHSVEFVNDKKLYFKHPTLTEHFNLYRNYNLYISYAEKIGVLKESDQLEKAVENKWWSVENESKISFLKKTIKNLYTTREKLFYQSQKKDLDQQIKYYQKLLISYEKERKDLINYTAEEYAEGKFLDNLLINLIYKDENLTEKFFETSDVFYELEDETINTIKSSFQKYTNLFSSFNLKRVAVTGFFQNLVYLTSEPTTFWGKPASQCSKYQIDLLVYGKIYRNIIESYHKGSKDIPQDISEDPDLFVEWIDNQGNDNTSKSKSKNRNSKDSKNLVSSYVGASKEDLDKMGVKVEKIKGKSLLAMAEEKGGTLEKSDYLNVRENH